MVTSHVKSLVSGSYRKRHGQVVLIAQNISTTSLLLYKQSLFGNSGVLHRQASQIRGINALATQRHRWHGLLSAAFLTDLLSMLLHAFESLQGYDICTRAVSDHGLGFLNVLIVVQTPVTTA